MFQDSASYLAIHSLVLQVIKGLLLKTIPPTISHKLVIAKTCSEVFLRGGALFFMFLSYDHFGAVVPITADEGDSL